MTDPLASYTVSLVPIGHTNMTVLITNPLGISKTSLLALSMTKLLTFLLTCQLALSMTNPFFNIRTTALILIVIMSLTDLMTN